MNEDRPSAPGPREASTTAGLPVAPSMGPLLEAEHAPRQVAAIDRRVLLVSALSIGVAVAAGFIARLLTGLIGLITNLSFYGKISTRSFASARREPPGRTSALIVVPVVGGALDRRASWRATAPRPFADTAFPRRVEQVLTNESRIPARMTLLKPLSAAVSIGTGGPFGAEGPIIATGGALGSLLGQLIETTADERKTLLAAGAAAGMAATFGTPVSALLLAIELLLFEFRARSIIPVALATVDGDRRCGSRSSALGEPVFAFLPTIAVPSGSGALAAYAGIGALVGVASIGVTRKLVYAIEDVFERLPVHWMWWPALGGLAVGVVGYLAPHTLGVGYDNIDHILSRRRSAPAGRSVALVRLEARLVVDRARQRDLGGHARPALHHRRRRSARC